jgi:hypothetical protein
MHVCPEDAYDDDDEREVVWNVNEFKLREYAESAFMKNSTRENDEKFCEGIFDSERV